MRRFVIGQENVKLPVSRSLSPMRNKSGFKSHSCGAVAIAQRVANVSVQITLRKKMSSTKLTIAVLVFIYQLISSTNGDFSSGTTVCGKDESSRDFLDTAVEFIEKAKKNIEFDMRGSNRYCGIKPVDCEELLHCGHNKSGVYTIWPRNKIIKGTVQVYCDMDTDQGGWTVIQRRGNFDRSKDYFFKDWESYKKGFGDIEKDFWLGNDLIFAISNQREYSIRVDLRDVEGNTRHALYDDFWIDDERRYIDCISRIIVEMQMTVCQFMTTIISQLKTKTMTRLIKTAPSRSKADGGTVVAIPQILMVLTTKESTRASPMGSIGLSGKVNMGPWRKQT